MESPLDHGGSWVRIASGTRIFFEFSLHLISVNSANPIFYSVSFLYRADEEAYVSERDDSTGGTHDWDRVCRMCDFNPKGTKNTKDVTRMRSIFLQLKQNPLVR